jgi:hypothetical protein
MDTNGDLKFDEMAAQNMHFFGNFVFFAVGRCPFLNHSQLVLASNWIMVSSLKNVFSQDRRTFPLHQEMHTTFCLSLSDGMYLGCPNEHPIDLRCLLIVVFETFMPRSSASHLLSFSRVRNLSVSTLRHRYILSEFFMLEGRPTVHTCSTGTCHLHMLQ